MVNYTPGLSGAFSALADPTRRRIVERLARGGLTVGEIAAEFPISAPAISKHLRVLESSGLMERRIEGRVHHCTLAPRALDDASQWIDAQRRFWNAAFDRLDTLISTESHRKDTEP